MTQTFLLRTALLAVLTVSGSNLIADNFRLGSPFSDHMVLQREKPIAIWGWADAGETVTTSFANQSKSVTAGSDGKWQVKLDALSASTQSRTLVVTGKRRKQGRGKGCARRRSMARFLASPIWR